MRLPVLSKLSGIFKKSPERKKPYLSLIFTPVDVAGACWYVLPGGGADVTHAVTRKTDSDSWEDRIIAADEVIGALEERLDDEQFDDVILGLPAEYLTEDGDIHPDIRGHIKEATKQLDLHGIGFVSINQAIVYHLKHDTGIPPTIILLQITDGSTTVFYYSSGKFIGAACTDPSTPGAVGIEGALVRIGISGSMPAKMMLYGTNQEQLAKLKAECVAYPWATKLKFSHFPKIEVLPPDYIVTSVSLAGSGEMIGAPRQKEVEEPKPETEQPHHDVETETKTELPLAQSVPVIEQTVHDSPETPDMEKDGEVEDEEEKEEEEDETSDVDEDITLADEIEGVEISEPKETKQDWEKEEAENVMLVKPEELGFQSGKDILETPAVPVVKEPALPVKKISLEKVRLPTLHLPHGNKKFIIAAIILGILALGVWILSLVLPRASVTVTVQAKTLTKTLPVLIDPSASAVNPDKNIIPGKKIEQTVSGDKTVPATGKKKIGTPARGSVTIYNKTVSGKTFKKGAILLSSGIQFSLDSDTSIASASESIGSITFGKSTSTVTAVDIGSEGNLPTGSEFVFRDTADSVASARSDSPFTGGTSKNVTVVSRADYDALVKAVSTQLVSEVKSDLGASSGATTKLIESTVKTTVTGKKFSVEIDEEAKDVSGTISITATGTGYAQEDLERLMRTALTSLIPDQFSLEEKDMQIRTSPFQLKKDGTIAFTATASTSAIPQIDAALILKQIANKNIQDAVAEVKKINGVQDITYIPRNFFWRKSFPQASHISVQIQVNQ